jgi:hypothetical protein
MTQQPSGKEDLDAIDLKGQAVGQGSNPMKIVETLSGFTIQNPAVGASPPTSPDRISRAVNSG